MLWFPLLSKFENINKKTFTYWMPENEKEWFKNKYLSGSSGYLQLDEFNKIRRDLIIIKFKNGIAKKVSF